MAPGDRKRIQKLKEATAVLSNQVYRLLSHFYNVMLMVLYFYIPPDFVSYSMESSVSKSACTYSE